MQVRPRALTGPLPLEIDLATEGSPVVRRVEQRPAGGAWALDSRDPVRDVRINEDQAILAEVKKVTRPEELSQR